MEVKIESLDDSTIDVSNSSGSQDLHKTLPQEALNNFLQGKKHLIVYQEYAGAVFYLETACELYAKHFGELAIECGEVYFLYGKAIFSFLQEQAVLFLARCMKVKWNGANEDEAEGEKNEAEECEKEEKEPSESTDSPPARQIKAMGEGRSEEDDLELAQEFLEKAQSIFQRNGTVESQMKVADILFVLALISTKLDNYTNAINVLKQCLDIRQKHLNPDDQDLAGTHLNMAFALFLEKIYPLALENFREAQRIYKLCIEKLKNELGDDVEGPFAAAEIKDIESNLLDIKKAIDDTEELISNKKKELEESAFDEVGVSGI